MSYIFTFLDNLDGSLWTYICTPILVFLGIVLTILLKFPQFKNPKKQLHGFFSQNTCGIQDDCIKTVHPAKAFFTTIGGCIGLGNIVAVCSAVKIGGPGALVWIWLAAFLGMSIKYAEVYLGIKFRVINDQNELVGGPMYYLQKVFNGRTAAILYALFLIIYGTEIYMFNVVSTSISQNYNIPQIIVVIGLLFLIFLGGAKGVSKVGTICSYMIPIFVIVYVTMVAVVFSQNINLVIPTFKLIFYDAFTSHGVIGGFVGTSILTTMYQGIARGCYSGDIGVGYAGIINACANTDDPKKQAYSAVFGVFIDTFIIVTATVLLIVVTKTAFMDIPPSMMVQEALTIYFPGMQYFMPIFLFLLGYSTLIAFFCVGKISAEFISPKMGKNIYYIFALLSFSIFSFVDETESYILVSICGALLLIINCVGIYKLRGEVE